MRISVLLLLASCARNLNAPPDTSVESGDTDVVDTEETDETDVETDTDTDTDADADTDTDADTDADSDTDTDADPAAEMCARWNADRAVLTEGSWSGDAGTCAAGDIPEAARDRAVKVMNLYRSLADLPAIDHDPAYDAAAQDCALMMHANETLSHFPTADWACYSDTGAATAGKSNIATAPAVTAMDLYMDDWGNESTLGHRRWLLSNWIGDVGVGSTDSYSCLDIFDGTGAATNAWTAYPTPGPFPFEAIDPFAYLTLDDTGWSIQSDTIDLSGASVTITNRGTNMPVTVRVLEQYYGSNYAISIIPKGWRSEEGETYTVTVTGTATAITYDVEMVGC